MNLEGTGGALDTVSEIKEVEEIPDTDPNASLPDIPEVPEVPDKEFDSSIERIKGPEDAEKIIDAEAGKAATVVDFTQGAIGSAKEATGAPSLFEEEEKELQSLKNELAGLNNERPDEKIETIAPTANPVVESQQNRMVNIHGVEITGLNEDEVAVTERAANLVYYSSEKAQSLEEVRGLTSQLESLNAREFPDDAKFDQAVGVFMQESNYFSVHMPLIIENGARDVATGKTTPIEIISSEEEQNSVKRPTPEQLQQAEKDMLNTSHGRINEMYFYLKDIEAVASGNMNPYLKMMPKERLMEFVRKSYFEESVSLAPENKEEVIGGLALTWEDTASYYESEGDTPTAERIRSTGRFEVSETASGDHIVGEQHLRLVNIPEYQQRFNSLLAELKSGDFVIVEHASDPKKNVWTTLSSEIRFMQQAEGYPNEINGIDLEIMDDETKSKWDAWENSQQEVEIDRSDFFYVNGLLDASQKIFAEGGIEKLIMDIQGSEELSDDDKKASLLGIQKFMKILISDPEQSKQGLAEINRLRQLYMQLDSNCRERVYQEKVASIKSEHPEATLLVVVGNAHREGITGTMENPDSRTMFDQAAVREFQDLIEKV